MRKIPFIAPVICLSLLLGCSTVQTDDTLTTQPEIAASSPSSSSASEPEPEGETLSSVAEPSEGNEPPAEKALAQYVVSLDDIETNKWIYAIELIPGYQYDDPEQEPYELVIDMGEYQIGWSMSHAAEITIYSESDKTSLSFEEIRPAAYAFGFPNDAIELGSTIYDTSMSVVYTGSKLYFVYMAEMTIAQQTYQIYQWDLVTKEMQFVSQYPGCGLLDVLEIDDSLMVLLLCHSWGPNRLISKIDLETGQEVSRLEGKDVREFLQAYHEQSSTAAN